MITFKYLTSPTLSVMYFDQLLLAARKVHVVYFDQLLGAAHYIHFFFMYVASLRPLLFLICSPYLIIFEYGQPAT